MTKSERIQILEQVIQDTFWMARRYAHGRHTYAPGMVRDAYNDLKKLGIKIQHDTTIKEPTDVLMGGMISRDDYLDDINE